MQVDYSVYLCTERSYLKEETLEQAVEQAILGGCSVVQLREKELDSKEFYETAKRLKEITDAYQVPLLINDRLDIALAVDAAGVHLGQSDLPADVARRLLGPDKIIGVTAKTVEQAVKAQADGADYLGVGAMYPSPTKKNARGITIEELKSVTDSVTIPVVAIGGITADKIKELRTCDIQGVAVISAILKERNKKAAARGVRDAWEAR